MKNDANDWEHFTFTMKGWGGENLVSLGYFIHSGINFVEVLIGKLCVQRENCFISWGKIGKLGERVVVDLWIGTIIIWHEYRVEHENSQGRQAHQASLTEGKS